MAISTDLTRPTPRSKASTNVPPRPSTPPGTAPRRIASNFVFMSLAEIICRGTSVAVTLTLAKRLGMADYGRVGFAFDVVFWLVLLVRDAFEVIISRELARHPRIVRPLVNHVLALRGILATGLFFGLVTISSLTLRVAEDRAILALYGLLLLTTALGLDFVYRGTERMGLVALSLCVRTVVYASGVLFWVGDPGRIVWVPVWLAVGEACGITLVWACYTRQYGLPRPVLGLRFLRVFLKRGRSVCCIQVAQTIISTSDLLVVDMMSRWSEVGRYGAPHRMVTALLTFGMIFQQVSFPTLARSWRQTTESGRDTLNAMVRVLMTALIPVAVGGAVLSGPLVEWMLTKEYAGAGVLLALGIWRAPLLSLAYLYQITLIAVNREAAGVRLLLTGALTSAPLAALLCWLFGLAGAASAVLLIGLSLVVAGYVLLARESRQPAWHHHLGKPLIAAAGMVPVCLLLAQYHVAVGVLGGALSYLSILFAVGGVQVGDLHRLLGRKKQEGIPAPHTRGPRQLSTSSEV